MFDCVLATRIARNGTVLTSKGRVVVKNGKFAHVFHRWTKPATAMPAKLYAGIYPPPVQREGDYRRTVGVHPQFAVPDPYDEEIREAIKNDRLLDYRREFYERYDLTKNF